MSDSLFPGQVDTFLDKQNQEIVSPGHINKIQDAVVSLEQEVLRLASLIAAQQSVDLTALTGGITDWTLADAKQHAQMPHGESLSSLAKGASYGLGLNAEQLFDRTIEDVHTNRNVFLVASGIRTTQVGGNWTASWDVPMQIVYRTSPQNNAHTITSVKASAFPVQAGDAIYVLLPRDIQNQTLIEAQKASLSQVPFVADGNEVLILAYFNGSELVLRNGLSSQIRNYQVADDAAIDTVKIAHAPFSIPQYAEAIGGNLKEVVNTIFSRVVDIDQRLGAGVMLTAGGAFEGPVEFMPGGVTILKGEDDNGEILFGDGSQVGTTRMRDTVAGLEVSTSKRLDLNAAQGVWIGGQNVKAPGAYQVVLGGQTVAANGEHEFTLTFGSGAASAIPVFPVGITPQVVVSDTSAPGKPFFLVRANGVTRTGMTLTLKNVSGAPLTVDNTYRLFILS